MAKVDSPLAGGTEAAAPDAALRAEFAAALAATGPLRRLSPLLRRHYHASHAQARAAELRRLAFFGPPNYLAILGLTCALLVGWPSTATTLLLFVAIPACVVAIGHFFYRADASEMRREGAALVNCCLVIAGMTAVFAFGPADKVALQTMFVTCAVTGSIVVTRQPAAYTVGYLTFAILALIAALALRPDAPAALAFYPVIVLVSSALPALIAIAQLERSGIDVYLRDLAKSLAMDDLSSAVSALDDLALRDPLTGIGNRRRFERSLAEVGSAAAGRHALLLIDVDHFKGFNDRFGHQAGDQCLRDVAALIAAELGPRDVLARIGGDEFAVLAPDVAPSDAKALAKRLCAGVEGASIGGGGAAPAVSLSIGGAAWRAPGEPQALLARADAALYEAKRAGRAQACWAPEALGAGRAAA